MIEFLSFLQEDVALKVAEHLEVSFIAVGIALCVGLGLGIGMAYFGNKVFSWSILNLMNVIVTIPAIAMLGFMVPLFGIGMIPAVIALVLYAQLPILRNTYTGLTTIAPTVVEAADGLGLSKLETLFKIRFPMAFPVIMAGVRNAIVITIGIATLAAFIGAGGLGDLIFRGIERSDINLIIAGTIPTAMLGIVADLGLRVLEDRFTSEGLK